MNTKKFSDAMSELDIKYVDEATNYKKKVKRPAWLKWGAMAACLCLVVSIAIPALNSKVGSDGQEDVVNAIVALEFNGMFYEAVNIPEVLKKYGLPTEITADIAGEHISYLESDGGAGYNCTVTETDIELYQYAPSPCDGVLVLRDGDTWYVALFCNFYELDSNTVVAMTELYRVYGIECAEDIASITEMGKNNDKEIGKPVTDSLEISEFYDITISLPSYGNDDFQELTFSGVPEEEQQAFHSAFADDRRNLRIETTEGLRFFIDFYPSYDWLESGGTLSYYRINEQMYDWISRNLE